MVPTSWRRLARPLAAGLALAGALGAQDPKREEADILARLQADLERQAGQEGAQPAGPGLHTSVVSASNRLEQLWGAPAHLVVLDRETLEARGYRDLSELLDDLPGMDLARHYGDDNFKNYWRGYRNAQGDPYLVLVDGRNTNDF